MPSGDGFAADQLEWVYKGVHSNANIRAYCRSNYTIEAAAAVLSDAKVICKVPLADRPALGFYAIKHQECSVPFGAGPRVRVAATFAMMEMIVALATLLQCPRFSTVEGALCESIHRIALRPQGCMVVKVTAVSTGG